LFYLPIQKLTMKRKLFLPEDVLGIIREYSKPIGTRLDWRKCKRKESRIIKMSNRAICLWYKWYIGKGYSPLFEEIMSWTFYGRRHLLWESRNRHWTDLVDFEMPGEQDPDYYEKRFIMREEWPQMVAIDSIEFHMSRVSLIV
jgi:hypothetical protein